jgi:hypothetical protein
MDKTQALAARRAMFARAGKYLLIAAFSLWLLMTVFTTTPGMADDAVTYLLTSRMRFVSAHLGVDAKDIVYVWGGPVTVGGIMFFAISFSVVGFALIVRRRLRQGRWSLVAGRWSAC